jgi:hypothetical protein
VTTGYRDNPGYLYVFNTKLLDIEWYLEKLDPKPYGLAVGDVDGDSVVEIVIGTKLGYVYVYDSVNRTVKWKTSFLGLDVLGVTLRDLNADNIPEIIIAQGGYAGIGDWTSNITDANIYIFDGQTQTLWISTENNNHKLILHIVLLVGIIGILFGVMWKLRRQKS